MKTIMYNFIILLEYTTCILHIILQSLYCVDSIKYTAVHTWSITASFAHPWKTIIYKKVHNIIIQKYEKCMHNFIILLEYITCILHIYYKVHTVWIALNIHRYTHRVLQLLLHSDSALSNYM